MEKGYGYAHDRKYQRNTWLLRAFLIMNIIKAELKLTKDKKYKRKNINNTEFMKEIKSNSIGKYRGMTSTKS